MRAPQRPRNSADLRISIGPTKSMGSVLASERNDLPRSGEARGADRALEQTEIGRPAKSGRDVVVLPEGECCAYLGALTERRLDSEVPSDEGCTLAHAEKTYALVVHGAVFHSRHVKAHTVIADCD